MNETYKLIENDPIFERFLNRQMEEGIKIARESDLLSLHMPPFAPPHFVAEYRCRSLVRGDDGEIFDADHFQLGVWFPPDYLRRADPFEMLRLFTPGVWHPNVSPPFICIGKIAPGMSLVDILFQVWDILAYQKFNPREDNALNKAACAWVRSNQDRFPTDLRPLKRRALNLEVKAR
jgi:ubiquitin-protein ligase